MLLHKVTFVYIIKYVYTLCFDQPQATATPVPRALLHKWSFNLSNRAAWAVRAVRVRLLKMDAPCLRSLCRTILPKDRSWAREPKQSMVEMLMPHHERLGLSAVFPSVAADTPSTLPAPAAMQPPAARPLQLAATPPPPPPPPPPSPAPTEGQLPPPPPPLWSRRHSRSRSLRRLRRRLCHQLTSTRQQPYHRLLPGFLLCRRRRPRLRRRRRRHPFRRSYSRRFSICHRLPHNSVQHPRPAMHPCFPLQQLGRARLPKLCQHQSWAVMLP